VVAACSSCNLRKRNPTPQQARTFPRQPPFVPTEHQLHRNGRLFPPNYLHDSWLDYLYWDTELDPQGSGSPFMVAAIWTPRSTSVTTSLSVDR
jgi:hypothetical protein